MHVEITKVLVNNHDLLVFNHLKEFICIYSNNYSIDDIDPNSTREY